MNLRSELLLMYMRDSGFEKAARTDSSGMLLVPLEFYNSLSFVYDSLGKEGLEELTIQSGFDAFGKKVG